MMKSVPFLFLFFLCSTCIAAQDDLRQDSAFFFQQAEVYQTWLDKVGFGQYLKVQELNIEENEVWINLAFHEQDVEGITAIWDVLENTYAGKPGFNLEEQLFYKAAALMELDEETLGIGLFDTYDLLKSYSFYREIDFDNGQVQMKGSGPKARIEPIKIFPQGLKGGTLSSVRKLQLSLTKEKVYTCILDYAKNRFTTAGVDGEVPEIKLRENQKNLWFEVVNVRKEVLQNTNLCGWLESLGLDCFWAKRELLTFLFTYDTNGSGIIITGDISGKVGSTNYFNARKGSYRNMETEFADELLAYLDDFTVEVSRQVRKCE